MDYLIELHRRWPKANYTIGDVYLAGKKFCNSLEPPVTGDGVVAIPPGVYEIDVTIVSPKYKERSWAKKYGGIVPTITNVPGRDRILIHPGNTVADTSGCILPGVNREKGKVLESVKHYDVIMESLLKAHAEGKCLLINVTMV